MFSAYLKTNSDALLHKSFNSRVGPLKIAGEMLRPLLPAIR